MLTTFAEFVAWHTARLDELEERIIARALATGHPELATPFPKQPSHAKETADPVTS